MHNKINSEVVTKQKYPEFFEVLEKSLAGLGIPEITVGEDRICFSAKASHLSYSIFFDRMLWDKLNNEERVAAALHEIGHLNSPIRRLRIYPLLLAGLLVIPAFLFFIFLLPSYSTICLVIYVRFFFIGILCLVNQWDEYFADDFASQRIDKKYLISALKKLPREKPLYRAIYYFSVWPFETHPGTKERIARLLKKNPIKVKVT